MSLVQSGEGSGNSPYADLSDVLNRVSAHSATGSTAYRGMLPGSWKFPTSAPQVCQEADSSSWTGLRKSLQTRNGSWSALGAPSQPRSADPLHRLLRDFSS